MTNKLEALLVNFKEGDWEKFDEFIKEESWKCTCAILQEWDCPQCRENIKKTLGETGKRSILEEY